MRNNKPLVSVIVITYNESNNITKCLSRIRNQTYPQKKIEIVLVDGFSTDNTVKLAQKFNVKVLQDGLPFCERAKSIGIEHARGELILFVDADVFLMQDDFIEKTVAIFQQHPMVVAAQPIRWQYQKNDHIINRYCDLFGVINPLVMFLGKRGNLMVTETAWYDRNVIIHRGKYFEIAEFDAKNLPTVGSMGYMVRKRDIIKKTSWSPFFFHMDTAYELVEHGKKQFALTMLPVRHNHVGSFVQYHKKAYRNIYNFYKYRNYRKYVYDMNPLRLFTALFLMLTIIYPLVQSIKGYAKKRDVAWFVHPFLCVTIPVVYSYTTIKWHLENIVNTFLPRDIKSLENKSHKLTL